MPEQNKNVISKYQGEANFDKEYAKLAKKITDVAKHMIGGVGPNDPEYWGLKEVLSPEHVKICNRMKLRKFYTFEELVPMNKDFAPARLKELLEEMSVIGIIEYDYGDNYSHTAPIPNAPHAGTIGHP